MYLGICRSCNFARKMTAFSTHPQDSIFWGMVEEPINWLFEGGVSNIFNNIGYGFIASFPTPPKFASKLANLPSLKGRVIQLHYFIGFVF